MATDRSADIRIKGNAGPGGVNPLSKAQQKALDAQIAVGLTKVKNPVNAPVIDPATAAANAARDAINAQNAAAQQQQRTDWIEQLSLLFKNYGLESLAPLIKQYVQDGYSADTVTLKLQDAPEYQRRFAGNESRKKAGLPVLSPAEYLATESAYKQIMRTAGLPEGFYDSYDDFSGFIGIDVSPSELKSRVDAASLSLEGSDPYYKESLQSMYGLSSGDMLAYTLDPQRSLPFINKRVQSAQFGAAARRQGLNIGISTAEQYADMGVTKEQAEQGFKLLHKSLQLVKDFHKFMVENKHTVKSKLLLKPLADLWVLKQQQDVKDFLKWNKPHLVDKLAQPEVH